MTELEAPRVTHEPRHSCTTPDLLVVDETLDGDHVIVYTDGASEEIRSAFLRRAGVGTWWAETHPSQFSIPLEGHRQTNQRAELDA